MNEDESKEYDTGPYHLDMGIRLTPLLGEEVREVWPCWFLEDARWLSGEEPEVQ